MSEQGKCVVCQQIAHSRCSWCHSVFYCTKEHQKKDWAEHKEICTKVRYKVGNDENLGRFLEVTEDIKSDQFLFKDKPILLGPRTDLVEPDDSICFGCHKSILPMAIGLGSVGYTPCPSCNLPLCTLGCSTSFFHSHFECKLLSSCPNVNSEQVYMRNKFLNKLRMNLLALRGILLKMYNPKDWEILQGLEANLGERGDPSNLDNTTKVHSDLSYLMGEMGFPPDSINKSDLHFLIGVIETNSVEIRISPAMELYGIFPNFSLIEHNCTPNTKFYLMEHRKSGYTVFVRSAVKLKAGNHLQICYTNLLWNTLKRREHLRKTKYFLCECPRCTDPTELGTNFSTILCPICKAHSLPTPKKASTPSEIVWRCTNAECGKGIDPWQVKKVDMKLGEAVSKIIPAVETYQESLDKMYQLVHPNYYLTFPLNHSLVQLIGQNGINPGEVSSGGDLETKIEICRKLLDLIKILDPGQAKLNLYAGVLYYELHSAILCLAGGEREGDYLILSKTPETVKMAIIYLQKCIDAFKYEYIDLPENKLKALALKKIEYLNIITKRKYNN